jgi:IclR family transcriptional regulator, KDG regulon repressor
MPPVSTNPLPATPRSAARSRRYRNQAAQRVLAVLSCFAGPERDLGVTELALRLGMNKNMVHRALTTLAAQDYVTRAADRARYQLGYRVLTLAGDDDAFDIRALCRPALEELHALTGESVFLSIIVGRARVNVDWIEARGRRVSASQRGRSVPLHCTRMSRALLACLDDREIDAYLAGAAPLTRYDEIFPETAGATAQDVWDDVARVRRDGFMTWRNPQQYGANYIGFPLLDSAGRPHALITVGGPLERFGPERIGELMAPMCAILQPVQQHARHVAAAPVIIEGS